MKPSWLSIGILTAACLFGSPVHAADDTSGKAPLLRLDLGSPQETEARNFRTTLDPYKSNADNPPSRIGLAELRASGSGEFSVSGLKALREKLQQEHWIDIDLRQESHGFFNGEAPVSWYARHDWANRDKDLKEIDADENSRLKASLKQAKVNAYAIHEVNGVEEHKAFALKVASAATEAEIASQAKVGYFRIPVTDHLKPTDADVDRFLEIVRSLAPGAWVHFHCEAGDGRTTTFLSMYDMLKNAKQVSFEDILRRQWLIGGINLLEAPAADSWKYPYALERTAFLWRFYEFAKTAPQENWSTWIANHR